MARLQGIKASEAPLGLRLVYSFVRRKLAKVTGRATVPMPIQVTAHHPRLLRALASMEMGQEAAQTVPARLKLLASIQVARRIGCPY
jgi:hypothetical protein